MQALKLKAWLETEWCFVQFILIAKKTISEISKFTGRQGSAGYCSGQQM